MLDVDQILRIWQEMTGTILSTGRSSEFRDRFGRATAFDAHLRGLDKVADRLLGHDEDCLRRAALRAIERNPHGYLLLHEWAAAAVTVQANDVYQTAERVHLKQLEQQERMRLESLRQEEANKVRREQAQVEADLARDRDSKFWAGATSAREDQRRMAERRRARQLATEDGISSEQKQREYEEYLSERDERARRKVEPVPTGCVHCGRTSCSCNLGET